MDSSNETMSETRDLLKASIGDFRKGLEKSVPLRHFSQFYDESMIRAAADVERKNVLKKLMEDIPEEKMASVPVIVTDLFAELQKINDECLKKNEDHKRIAKVYFEKEVDLACLKLRATVEAKLLINPKTDMKSLESLLENGKLLTINYFEFHSNLGNSSFYDNHMGNLKERLDSLGVEMIEKQRRHLENVEADKQLDEVKTIILEMSKQIKLYVDTLQGQVSKQVLKERAQIIHEYLDGKGYVLNEKHERIWSKLIGTAKAAVTVLNNAEENMSTEDCIRFAERLDMRLKILCSDAINESPASNEKILASENVSKAEGAPIDQNVFREKETSLIEGGGSQSEGQSRQTNQTLKVMEPSYVNIQSKRNQEEVDMQQKQNIQEVSLNEQVSVESFNMDEAMDNKTELVIKRVAKRGNPQALKDKSVAATSSSSKRKKIMDLEDSSTDIDSDVDFYVEDKCRDSKFLRAIQRGKSVTLIKKMLDDGANVNAKHDATNAVDAMIDSLTCHHWNTSSALDILNLLANRGFTLFNERIRAFNTPLCFAVLARGVDERVLEWFYNNGADFNDEDIAGNSVLLLAVRFRGARIIRKILEYGGNPKFQNRRKENALHLAAQ